jgi:hypothetical protein
LAEAALSLLDDEDQSDFEGDSWGLER